VKPVPAQSASSSSGGGDEANDDVIFFMRSAWLRSPASAPVFWLGDQLVSWDGNDGLRSALKGNICVCVRLLSLLLLLLMMRLLLIFLALSFLCGSVFTSLLPMNLLRFFPSSVYLFAWTSFLTYLILSYFVLSWLGLACRVLSCRARGLVERTGGACDHPLRHWRVHSRDRPGRRYVLCTYSGVAATLD
jgi:hypothetical protein